MGGIYKNKAYTLRIDNELMEKLKVIASKEDRPINKQIERITRQYINQYEQEHGEIILNNTDCEIQKDKFADKNSEININIGKINQTGDNYNVNF